VKNGLNLFQVASISSIQDLIIKSSKKYANKIALEDFIDYPISKVTYSQLYQYVIKFGKALYELGIKEQDHIAVIGENRVQWGIVYLSSMAFNLIIVPIDKNLSSNDIINILHESDTKAIVFSETFHQIFSDMKSSLPNLKYLISMDLKSKKDGCYSMFEIIEKQDPKDVMPPTINPDDLAEIIFTSGSLGRAKGVMLTQKGLAANLMGMTAMVNITSEDRFFSVLPIHHTYECTCGFLCPLYVGASTHYCRSLKTILEDIQKAKPTVMLGAPLLFNKIYAKIIKNISENKFKSVVFNPIIKITNFLELAGWKNSKKLFLKELHNKFGGALRLLVVGGAAPNPEVAKGFREFGFNFIQGYGSTETSPILTLNRLGNFKDKAAGLPLPGVEIMINKPDKSGVGEVYAKGDNVMLGYYNNNKLTEEAFENGWFRTGDLGFIDKDGFLHLSGRKKNVIIANNGENVYPEEIEDLLSRSPFILECMVYGQEDEKHDEIIAAQIVANSETFIEYATKNNIKITSELINEIISDAVAKINKELAAFKRIKKFYIRETEFEKTTTQKIKRHLVQTENYD
jgi:long-chain acyl-CoA synthetase